MERNITADKEIDQTKTEFITLASHQLRTPLTNISLSLDILLRDPAVCLNDQQKDRVKGIYRNVHDMAGLVSTLLDASKIQLGSFAVELKEVNIIQAAENALNQIAPEIYAKGIRLVKEYDSNLPLALSDANIIKTILQNLLSNAAKYTPAKGVISFIIKKKNNNILFQVRDSGWGIPREEQPRVFSKYFRAQNIVTREARGSGLGLYLTRQLINSIQGKIWFRSREDEGTTFSVSLPLARQALPDHTPDRCPLPTEEPPALAIPPFDSIYAL